MAGSASSELFLGEYSDHASKYMRCADGYGRREGSAADRALGRAGQLGGVTTGASKWTLI
jgi:hypothetical protein